MRRLLSQNSVLTESPRTRKSRGFVMITMAAAVIALMGIMGLSVDVGTMLIAKNETQAYCDAAALGAAMALDGTTAGITKAQAVVSNSTNKWNFGTKTVTSPTVTFATSLAGPWDPNPNPATNISHVRVSATAALSLYFLPVIVHQTTQNVTSTATAAQVALNGLPRGLAPYTAVSTDNTPPNFGLVVGNSYDIQWPNGNACSPSDHNFPDTCFVKPPCSGDGVLTRTAVATNWGSSFSGYWGANNSSDLQKEVMDAIQLAPVDLGTNLLPVMSTGNKNTEGAFLDQRAAQDVNTTDNIVGDPYTSGTYYGDLHNGRRLISIPIVDPTSTTTTTVIGYGAFLLLVNGTGDYYTKVNGNAAYCALYAGPYNVGSIGGGTGGTTGATRVKLVQ
jgi:Flp pilus assembly protein TadG